MGEVSETNAREFLDFAIDHGASVMWQRSEDTGGNPYVTITVLINGWKLEATWHTRETGTYRLFSLIARGPNRGWHDVTLAKARELITKAAS